LWQAAAATDSAPDWLVDAASSVRTHFFLKISKKKFTITWAPDWLVEACSSSTTTTTTTTSCTKAARSPEEETRWANFEGL
jgi:hypothetical protein